MKGFLGSGPENIHMEMFQYALNIFVKKISCFTLFHLEINGISFFFSTNFRFVSIIVENS